MNQIGGNFPKRFNQPYDISLEGDHPEPVKYIIQNLATNDTGKLVDPVKYEIIGAANKDNGKREPFLDVYPDGLGLSENPINLYVSSQDGDGDPDPFRGEYQQRGDKHRTEMQGMVDHLYDTSIQAQLKKNKTKKSKSRKSKKSKRRKSKKSKSRKSKKSRK